MSLAEHSKIVNVGREARRALLNSMFRVLYRLGLRGGSKVIFVGHHKCATQFIKRVLADIAMAEHLPIHLHGLDWRTGLTEEIVRFNCIICVQNFHQSGFNYDVLSGSDYRGFHVIRDPRDILVSQYFSHRNSHPLVQPLIRADHEQLIRCSQAEGIEFLIVRSEYFCRLMDEMMRWDYGQKRFYETRFETLVADPVAEFGRIVDFVGLKLSPQTLDEILDRHSFKALQRESKFSRKHYRKGKPGDWRNHLDARHERLFEKYYGHVLDRLGYRQ